MYAITRSQPEVYNEFFDTTAHEYVINEKNTKHCPTPDCTFAFINDGAKQDFECLNVNIRIVQIAYSTFKVYDM